MTPRRAWERLTDEDGFFAGVDAVAFGVLVCLGVSLAVLHGWAVVQASGLARAAAAEAARVVAAEPVDGDAAARAGAAAERVAGGLGYDGEVAVQVSVDTASPRCSHVHVRVEVAVRSPVRGVASRAAGTAVRLVDPYTDGLSASEDGLPCAP